jgi:polyhydroxybutyrate depolymerase
MNRTIMHAAARPFYALVAMLVLSGCGGVGARVGAGAAGDRQTVEHDGRSRAFILRVPPSITPGRAVPLVIVLHGGGGNGLNAEAMTGFTSRGRDEGFIVVYPEGTARGRSRLLTWNAGHCCGYAMQAGIDDVGFLGALIDHLAGEYPVDRQRVYVTGMSNGAMMSHRAGIELPGRIAAIAPVAGGLFGDEAADRQRVSAIMINGMLDRSVPYGGGEPGGRFAGSWDGTPVTPAVAQAAFWAAANGCSTEATTVDAGAWVHVRHDCPAPLGVELYAVKDNGHAWPGGQRGSALGDIPSTALNATDVIWAFFSAHGQQ